MRFVWFSIFLCILTIAVGVEGRFLPPPLECPGILFQRADEAHEAAFSYLLPQGWITQGGMVRRDPLATGANSESVAAKLDFKLQSDSAGTAMIRWMPNVTYFDIGCSAIADDAQLFPPGSSYQGMLVYPLMPASLFITNLMIPAVHPFAGNIRIITEQDLQSAADQYAERSRESVTGSSVINTAATLTLIYEENGMTFKERWLTLVEDPGEIGGGQWTNRETVYFRAPEAEFDSLEAVFEVIQYSIIPDPVWIAHEMWQHIRTEEVSLRTRNDHEQSGRRLLTDHQRVTDDLHRAMFSNPRFTVQIVNPFNHSLEMASSGWGNMWMNRWGDILFTNDDSCDPNRETTIDRQEFRRCVMPTRETSMAMPPK
jgi:hypothetical protein